jgi:hypothetical protein
MRSDNLTNTGQGSEMGNSHLNWNCLLLRAFRMLESDGSCSCRADAEALNSLKRDHLCTPIVLNRMADTHPLAFVADWQLEAHGFEVSVGNMPVGTHTSVDPLRVG